MILSHRTQPRCRNVQGSGVARVGMPCEEPNPYPYLESEVIEHMLFGLGEEGMTPPNTITAKKQGRQHKQSHKHDKAPAFWCFNFFFDFRPNSA